MILEKKRMNEAIEIDKAGGVEVYAPYSFLDSGKRYVPVTVSIFPVPVYGIMDTIFKNVALFVIPTDESLGTLLRLICALENPSFDRGVYEWVKVMSVKWIGEKNACSKQKTDGTD